MKTEKKTTHKNNSLIGIVSLYGWLKLWDNYGTLLQNFALQTHLQKKGHRTFWIRTRATVQPKNPSMELIETAISSLRSLIRRVATPILGTPRPMQLANFNANHPRHFSEFIKKHVPVSSKEYTLEEIISAPPEADALIVGSDQIWRDVTGINFLNFGKSDTKRIAYAVSAPWPALAEDWFKSAMKYTPKFNAISVREVAGIQTCKKLDREDAVHVLDPVLLHEAEHYLDVIRKDNEDRTFKNEFVLGYFVNIHSLEEIPWDATVGFSKARENDLLTVPMQGAELVIPEQNIYTPSPSGWLNAFNKTECVVTNSYHGALFAIIMRKPFLVFLQGGIGSHQNGRFTSALEPLGLKHRMLELDEWKSASSETLEERMSTPIDWDDVTNRLNEWRQRSETFLEAALNS